MRLNYLIAGALFAAVCAHAVSPIAKVTAAPGLWINGKELPKKAAPTWPLVPRDTVVTHQDSAILMLLDDRGLMLPETSLQILENGDAVSFELQSGEVCLRTRKNSSLQVFAAGAEVALHHPFEGSVKLNPAEHRAAVVKPSGCQFPAPGWLSKKVLVPAAGAGAAAAAAAPKAGSSSPGGLVTGEIIAPPSPSRP